MKYKEFKNMTEQSQGYISNIVTIVNSTMINSFNKQIENITELHPDSILMNNLSSKDQAEIIRINKEAHDLIKEIWLKVYIKFLDIAGSVPMDFAPPRDLSEIKDLEEYLRTYSEESARSAISHWKNFVEDIEQQELSLAQYTENLYQRMLCFQGNLVSNISNNSKEVILAELAK